MGRSSTTYRPKWKTGNTVVIRVPERLAPEILRFAHELDAAPKPSELGGPAAVYRTAENVELTKPVNVSSVPHRSPFRYPGGKTWLIPYIRSWLASKNPHAGLLIEPFAGGGIVGLTAGFEDLVAHVVLVERDGNVAAVWQAIFGGQAEWLADEILGFQLDLANVVRVLEREPTTQRERAFAVILRNRVQRGGIMAPGAGLVKDGEKGHGLSSRWYPETLARRIREIAIVRNRFTFIEGDGLDVIQRYADDENTVFFADPPYTVASRRLYPHWELDHRRLLGLLASVKGDVLMTYDHTREMVSLADEFGFETEAIAMKNTHHAKMNELLIGKDLSWLRRATNERESRLQSGAAALAFRP